MYSQNREEEIILRVVAKREPGYVLDVGAHDGRTNSNSLALIERGWKAILVEPSPFAFAKLLDLHGQNPRVTLVNATVGTERRCVKFYECQGDQYSTTREDMAKLWETRGIKYRSYWVSQITVSELINEIGCGADILSIDCEGVSFDILTSIPSAWSPSVIVVEHDSRAIEITGWAAAKGYEVIGLNAENLLLMKVDK